MPKFKITSIKTTMDQGKRQAKPEEQFYLLSA